MLTALGDMGGMNKRAEMRFDNIKDFMGYDRAVDNTVSQNVGHDILKSLREHSSGGSMRGRRFLQSEHGSKRHHQHRQAHGERSARIARRLR